MSIQITEAFVQQYTNNFYMLSQQKGSRLRPYVRQESITGKAKAFDRIGAVSAQLKAGRHSDTPQIDTPHSRRWCYLADYEWADLIDQQDKVRLLNDPTSEYAMAAMWSMGRVIDDTIIAAAAADATTGEDQGGTASLPTTQQYACNDGTNTTNLNVTSLIGIKSKFGINDVDDSIQLHIAVDQRQLDALLAVTQVTSADYNSVKALVRGEIDTYMGFQFHRLQRLQTQLTALSGSGSTGVIGSGTSLLNYRKVIAWAQDGLISGVGQEPVGRISERDDKSYATQVYAMMSVGAVRMEEEKVVIAYAKES